MAVVQTHRVLLAKQLIQETRLPMTEVALAAGFGSVRRFNETFQQLFDRQPSALRRLRGPAASAAEAGVTVRLAYRAPYDWEGVIAFLTARAIPGVEVVDAEAYARTLEVDGACGFVVVRRGEGEALDGLSLVRALLAGKALLERA